jgi:hypothetical protein
MARTLNPTTALKWSNYTIPIRGSQTKKKNRQRKMRTLSRPTGPNELFTILAMAWQAMTALTPNNIDIKMLTISTACKEDERGYIQRTQKANTV